MIAYLVLGFILTSSTLANDAVDVKFGMINYTTAGFEPKTGSNVQNITPGWYHYWTKKHATGFAYQILTDAESGRILYQAALVNYRSYPWSLGAPLNDFAGHDSIEISHTLKPHLDVGFTYGRYFIQSFGANAELEASSGSMGLRFAGGAMWQVTQNLAFDFDIFYEQIFGHSSALAFSATHMGFLMGPHYFIH
jgi:hypothetical protein